MKIKNLLEQIENYLNKKIINSDLSDDQKVHKVIVHMSCFCAVIACQPFPFADIFILTPIQGTMAYLIAKIRDKTDYNNQTSKDRIKEIFEEIGLIVLGGQIAQHIAIALYKIGLPFLGGFMTIPLVFTLTYAMGQVFDFYFNTLKQTNLNQSKEELKRSLENKKEELKSKFKEARKDAKEMLKYKTKGISKEVKKVFKDKNLSLWEKLKKAVEILVKRISN